MAAGPAALVLLSALLHAVWNALVKRDEDPRGAGFAVLTVALLTAVVVALTGGTRGAPFPAGSLAWSLAAGAFEGLYFATLGLALARGPLGPVYTVARGGALLVTWPISIAALGEPFSWRARAGALLVGTGLLLTSWRSRETVGRGSLGWAFACAGCIAGYHLCYKLALARGAEPRALFAVALVCAFPVNAAVLGQRAGGEAVRALRRAPLRLVVAGAMCTASFLILLLELAQAGAGAVLTLRNLSIVFAQGLAVLSGERPSRRAVGGAALVVGGAFLLTR